MMVAKLKIFPCLAIFLASPSWANEKIKNFFQTPVQAVSIYDLGKYPVILVGDTDHRNQNFTKSLAAILPEWAGPHPSQTCLFFEMDTRFQPAIEQFLKNKNATVEYDINSVVLPIGLPEPWESIGAFAPIKLFNQAKAMNMPIFAVDIDLSTTLGQRSLLANDLIRSSDDADVLFAFATYTLDFRNQLMARNIKNHFRAGQCNKGILFAGDSHLRRDSFKGHEIKTIGQYLAEMGIDSIYGQFREMRCHEIPDEEAYEECWGHRQRQMQNILVSPLLAPTSGQAPHFQIWVPL